MKVERIHNETVRTVAQAEQLIRSLKKTETLEAIDPDLPRGYQHGEDETGHFPEESDHGATKDSPGSPLPKKSLPPRSGVDLLA